MTRRIYSCPHCDATLNPNVKIVLTATNRGHRGLILLSPTPGNYDLRQGDDLDLRPGDMVKLTCPICGHDLASDVNPCLAEVSFRAEGGRRGKVDFSRKVGEHATYVVTRESIRSYGENADIYSGNFFGGVTDE
jgi:hypothetical protein